MTLPDAPTPPSGRIISVDALRGFDMFWILGADGLVQALHRLFGDPLTGLAATQLDHCDWEGFRAYDLIFPMFVFIVGISVVFSLGKSLAGQGRGATVLRILRRGALLVALGIICYGGLKGHWQDVRLLGVLQRIGIAYAVTALLFCFCRPRVLGMILVGILIGYWALMTFVPIRDIRLDQAEFERRGAELGTKEPHEIFARTTATVSGCYEPGRNLANHLDFEYLPGRKWDKWYDPEGLLSTLPAVATCLLGVFAGLLLRQQGWSHQRRLAWLVGGGVACVLLGELWGLQFPVVKKIWTSSFVLVAGGWSALLLAAFYWMVDVRGWKRWTTPFIWIGSNAITAYLLVNLVDVRGLANRLVGGPVSRGLDSAVAAGLGDVVGHAAALGLVLALVWYLHRRQIFLRL